MPLTASLALDIDDFEQALAAAEIDLQTFAKATKTVNRDLTRMAEGFSGEKIASEAAKVEKVVADIGGASRLTAAEQKKVNATVTEAIEKYEKLGLEAPSSLRELQSATSATSLTMKDVATGAAVAAAAIVAVGAAVVKATSAVLDYTGKLTDLSAATGITTTDLQVLERVTAGTPTSLDTIAKATTNLAKSLIGDKGAAAAVKSLGLSTEELLAKNPADVFLELGAAVAGIENPMERTKVGTELFGKAWADVAPAVSTNMAEIGAQVRATGGLISEELVAAGDEAGDALARLQQQGMTLLAQSLLPLVPVITLVAEWLGQNLPPMVETAKSAIFKLAESWLSLRIEVQQTAADILKATNDIPLLGKAFGASSASVEYFQGLADESRSMLVALRLAAVEPLTAAVTKAAPPLSAYARGLNEAANAGKKAKEGVSFVDGELNPLTLAMIQGAVAIDKWGYSAATAESIAADLADQMRIVTGEAIRIGPALESSFKTNPLVPFRTALDAASTAVPGFFGKLKDGLTDAGINMQTLGQTFAAAFTGGGGALGAIQSFATQGLGALMSMIPLVGPFVSQFAGPIVAMLGKLGSKFKEFFGGVSEEEKKAREEVKAFEKQLASLLTETQRAEAGNDSWKQTVIAVRDAYIAAGKTEAEALAATEKLWKSSQEGAGATQEAIEEINAVLKAAGRDTVAFAQDVSAAVDAIPDEVVIDVVTRHRSEGGGGDAEVPGYQHGSNGVQDFGRGTLAMLHGREAVIPEDDLQRLTAPARIGVAPGAGSVVHIDARGAFLGDAASQIRLRRLVSEALMSEARLRRGMTSAGGF
jgi:hypothetical protein